jgi:sialate O-acetylesterase
MKQTLLTTIFTSLFVMCFSQTKLPLFFSDSMVLQRNTNAAIWGTDIANKKIKVTGSWGNIDSTITNSSGNWKLKLPTPAAGGPYTLTINGSSTIVIKDVQIGEVWLCAGQSNMEMPMKGYASSTPPQLVDSSTFFIANSLNTKLRVFMSGWNGTSRIPVTTTTTGIWETASPATTADFSATAYFFARKLQETLGIPIGVIVTARGGSTIESWTDSATLATVKPVVIPSVVNWQDAHETPTILYNTMLYPFIGFSIKGIVWSQGESNISNHAQYKTLFTNLITSWRTQWNQGEFPFYFAQLAPYESPNAWDDGKYPLLREAQLNTMLTTSNTGMAVTLDIGSLATVHYPKKKLVGDRLAQWALIKDYGKAGSPSGPVVKSMTIKNDTINLRFDYTDAGLTSFGLGLGDFEIAGANKVFYAATATAADFNYSINVRSSSVKNPLYVHYAFKNYVEGSLFNRVGLPASSFRTENLFTILPVTFGNISVANKNDARIVSWNTLVEINMESYDVQRSVDGISFTSIARITAKGSNANYQFEDAGNLSNQTLYYRIKANNNDGKIEHSNTVKSTYLAISSKLKIINPSHNGINIYCAKLFSGSIIITDNLGKTMATKQVTNHVGVLEIALSKAYKGIAFVKIVTADNDTYSSSVTVL